MAEPAAADAAEEEPVKLEFQSTIYRLAEYNAPRVFCPSPLHLQPSLHAGCQPNLLLPFHIHSYGPSDFAEVSRFSLEKVSWQCGRVL